MQLSYDPGLDQRERLVDLRRQTGRAMAMLGLSELADIRREAVAMLRRERLPWAWHSLRPLEMRNGDPAALRLTIRVWAPASARRVTVFGGAESVWVADGGGNLSAEAGELWFAEKLADVNDKARYRPQTLSFHTYSLHAPVAFLLFEHVFREGAYDVQRRVPIMAVRSGEDCYCADQSAGPIRTESAYFNLHNAHDLQYDVKRVTYPSFGSLVQGCHVRRSNHRIGCALDLNNFAFPRSHDGTTNPVTSSPRHRDRARMHAIDARNLPAWLYEAAKAMGYRIPLDWEYEGGKRDWTHLDLGRGE